MTQKKSYSRYFIILQEDEKGYALASDKLPSGYAKLEIKNDKCKISYYVQNLKEEATPYYMALICSKKDEKRVIKIGELNIDDHGRTEICYEYPTENVAGSRIAVDKVTGAAIVKLLDSNIVSVMSGFATTEIPDWKAYAIVEDDTKRSETKEIKEDKLEVPINNEEDKLEVPINNKEERKIEENVEEKTVSVFDEYEKEIEEVKVLEETPQDIIEPMEMERSEINNTGDTENAENTQGAENTSLEYTKQETEGINSRQENHELELEEEIRENIQDNEARNQNDEHNGHHGIELEEVKIDCDKKEHKEEKRHHNEDYPKGKVGDFFKNLAEDLEEMDDICSEIKRCRWYRIPACNLEDMRHINDYNKYAVIYYPMTSYYQYIKRHDHYMLGYKCDKEGKMKYLVYGIPGTKHRMDQPYDGRSGFVTWVPLVEGDEDEDSFGYWLMFYDFRNSTIVIPVKK